MTASSTERCEEISLDDVHAVQLLYDKGLYLRVHRQASAWGPFHQWRGTKARILAGRLAANLGAVRQSNWVIRCVWRSAPTDPEATYHYGLRLWQMRGPYLALRWMEQREELPEDTPPDIRSSWYALFGGIVGMLRDFDTGEQWM